MQQFMTLAAGSRLALSGIARISKPEKRPHCSWADMVDIHFADGRRTELTDGEAERLMYRPLQIIPAQPGWDLVFFDNFGPDEPAPIRTSIIAWALCADGEIRPVTPAGVCDGTAAAEYPYAVTPEGRVEAAGEYIEPFSFETLAEATDYFRKKAVERAAATRAEGGDA